jgi:hypothetical protein
LESEILSGKGKTAAGFNRCLCRAVCFDEWVNALKERLMPNERSDFHFSFFIFNSKKDPSVF